jgi:hypothetical protein
LPHVLRIAHGYGNRRDRIARALAAGVDAIEADLRFHRGRIWVRHERRLPGLPLLYNYRLGAVHREGPWSVSAGRHFFRLDFAPIRLEELLSATGDRADLLLDLKRGRYSPAGARRFVGEALDTIDRFGDRARVSFCGGWQLLDELLVQEPRASAYYSVDRPAHLAALHARLALGRSVPGVSIRSNLLDTGTAAFLQDAGIRFLCWDVDTLPQARSAVDLGASGILAADLDLLRAIAPAHFREAAG